MTGCDLTDNEPVQRLLWNMSWWNDRVQGWLFNPNRLAPTYPESAVDRAFRYNAFYTEDQTPALDPATYKVVPSGSREQLHLFTTCNRHKNIIKGNKVKSASKKTLTAWY